MIRYLLCALFSFLLFFIIHIISFHFFKIERRFRAMVFIALFSFISVFLLFRLVDNFTLFEEGLIKKIISGMAGFFLYLSLWYLYFNFIVIIDRSISVRMLMEIYPSRDKGLSIDELKERYKLEDKFCDEMKDLIFLKRIVQKDGIYRNTSKGSMHARVIRFLRDYLNLAKNR